MIKNNSNAKNSKKSAQPVKRLQDRKRRRLLTHSRIMRYGIRNFTRNAWLTVAATAVMTITLLILFVSAAVSHMLTNTVVNLREKVDISIYFKPETTEDTLRNLKGKMQLVDNVRSVAVTTSEDEYNEYISQIKSSTEKIQAISTLRESGVDPTKSFSAVMNVKVNNISNLQPVKDIVADDPQFQEWIDQDREPSYAGDQQATINKISSWASLAQKTGFIAGSVFLVISILVIFNTIRMAIFSRRDEINMMKSVGAEPYFIRGPFLIEAEMYGLLAAVVSTAFGYMMFSWITPGLGRYGVVVGPTQSVMADWFFVILCAMMITGIVIGYVSARLATRRYLK